MVVISKTVLFLVALQRETSPSGMQGFVGWLLWSNSRLKGGHNQQFGLSWQFGMGLELFDLIDGFNKMSANTRESSDNDCFVL